ncbi:MAG: hypothetical protein ACJAXH_001988, partial [Colwellia sp.]
MKIISKFKKWVLGILTTIILLAFAVLLFFRYEIDHVLGGNTEVVDTAQFKVISGM